MSSISETPTNPIKFALPKGKLMLSTAVLLQDIGLGFKDYFDKSRQYNLKSELFPSVSAKVFQEKDIPVQVAIGNYDLGICGLDWIEELTARYPASALIKIANLGYGEGSIYLSTSYQTGVLKGDDLQSKQSNWSIVSEYPNLAQACALNRRLRKFRIFPVWGASEAYPPENADLAVLWAQNEINLERYGLIPVEELVPSAAYLIGNRDSLENKKLDTVLKCFGGSFCSKVKKAIPEKKVINRPVISLSSWKIKNIKLALPDGHQQKPTANLLRKVGLNIKGYDEIVTARPDTDYDWLGIKVIRPQDMPLQIANGNFDLAITGLDWLTEHLYRYPDSPAVKLMDLKFGKVRIVAAVSQNMPVDSITDLKLFINDSKNAPLRVASEYVNTADKYLQENHIQPYKLIPTWGASEAFIPEDADLLIDNAETGKTLEKHKLKVIDVIFESTACMIGNRDMLNRPEKKDKANFLMQMLKKGLLC